ncbi:hypothetical protein J7E90_33095, partial [Streptomyces sp. ISL-111]|uniref:hypothetical protein n=1 Tax=Streptomyces sp. ISL-111 TaxID=2819175 RepID=UPI001BE5C5AB
MVLAPWPTDVRAGRECAACRVSVRARARRALDLDGELSGDRGGRRGVEVTAGPVESGDGRCSR